MFVCILDILYPLKPNFKPPIDQNYINDHSIIECATIILQIINN